MISVLTDYTTHSTWIQNEIDYYIVGHEYVKELLVYEGVDQLKKLKLLVFQSKNLS